MTKKPGPFHSKKKTHNNNKNIKQIRTRRDSPAWQRAWARSGEGPATSIQGCPEALAGAREQEKERKGIRLERKNEATYSCAANPQESARVPDTDRSIKASPAWKTVPHHKPPDNQDKSSTCNGIRKNELRGNTCNKRTVRFAPWKSQKPHGTK